MTLYVYTVSVIKKGKFNMANYLRFGQSLMKYLPTAEGCTSTVKLSKKGIESLAKKNPELGKVIEEMTRGAENSTLEIAQKAKGNYAIAGFKIRNGETVLGKGAYSTSTGANGVVEKMHVESGDIITTVTKEGDKIVSKDVTKADLEKLALERLKKQISNKEDAYQLVDEMLQVSNLRAEGGITWIWSDFENSLAKKLTNMSFEERNMIRKLSEDMKKEGISSMFNSNKWVVKWPKQGAREEVKHKLVFLNKIECDNKGIKLPMSDLYKNSNEDVYIRFDNQDALLKDLNSDNILKRMKAQFEVIKEYKKEAGKTIGNDPWNYHSRGPERSHTYSSGREHVAFGTTPDTNYRDVMRALSETKRKLGVNNQQWL